MEDLTILQGITQAIKEELKGQATSFVRTGYLLKKARDTNILFESGYANVNDYAAQEFGLSKDVVSRYIAINDRYSEDGYSEWLAERYEGYGYAKLAEMLTLPENIIETLSPELSKSDIREIKKEYIEEQTVSDIEVAIEAVGVEEPEESIGELILKEYFKNEPEEYLNLPDATINSMKEYLVPGVVRTIITRVPGVPAAGRLVMTLGYTDEIRITSMRGMEYNDWNWMELVESVKRLMPLDGETRQERWSRLYDMPWPVAEQPAEPQENKKVSVEKKPKAAEPKKKSKVTVVEKKKVAPVQPDAVKVEVVPGVTAEITDIEKASEAATMEEKKAEIMAAPDHTEEEEEPEVVYGEVENPSDRVNTRHETFLNMQESEYENQMNGYKEKFKDILQEIPTEIDNNMFSSAGRKLDELKELLSKMKNRYEEG